MAKPPTRKPQPPATPKNPHDEVMAALREIRAVQTCQNLLLADIKLSCDFTQSVVSDMAMAVSQLQVAVGQLQKDVTQILSLLQAPPTTALTRITARFTKTAA